MISAGLLLALALSGCSTGSNEAAELTTADGDATPAASDGIETSDTNDQPTTTAAPQTTAPPLTTTTAAPPPPPTTTAAPPRTTVRQATATTARPATTVAPSAQQSSSSSSCHSSYEGTCIPPDVADADCAGGSGNGPWYVQEENIRVVGQDVFDLDRDGDGIGCES